MAGPGEAGADSVPASSCDAPGSAVSSSGSSAAGSSLARAPASRDPVARRRYGRPPLPGSRPPRADDYYLEAGTALGEFTVTDATGAVIAGSELDPGQYAGWVDWTHPVTGEQMGCGCRKPVPPGQMRPLVLVAHPGAVPGWQG